MAEVPSSVDSLAALEPRVGEWRMAPTFEGMPPDFSPLDFAQRFTGTFSSDGETISGRWEIRDDGTTWKHDFDLTYRKAR